MDVESFDPRVIPQLLEFMHGYIAKILRDAQAYAEHAGHKDIRQDDLQLAISSRLSELSQAPPREVKSSRLIVPGVSSTCGQPQLPTYPPHAAQLRSGFTTRGPNFSD